LPCAARTRQRAFVPRSRQAHGKAAPQPRNGARSSAGELSRRRPVAIWAWAATRSFLGQQGQGARSAPGAASTSGSSGGAHASGDPGLTCRAARRGLAGAVAWKIQRHRKGGRWKRREASRRDRRARPMDRRSGTDCSARRRVQVQRSGAGQRALCLAITRFQKRSSSRCAAGSMVPSSAEHEGARAAAVARWRHRRPGDARSDCSRSRGRATRPINSIRSPHYACPSASGGQQRANGPSSSPRRGGEVVPAGRHLEPRRHGLRGVGHRGTAGDPRCWPRHTPSRAGVIASPARSR